MLYNDRKPAEDKQNKALLQLLHLCNIDPDKICYKFESERTFDPLVLKKQYNYKTQ